MTDHDILADVQKNLGYLIGKVESLEGRSHIIEKDLKETGSKVSDVHSNVANIRGWAAGFGAVAATIVAIISHFISKA